MPNNKNHISNEDTTRLSQCGIESLQIVSPPHEGTLKGGKYISVALKGDTEDCWVKDIVMREYSFACGYGLSHLS